MTICKDMEKSEMKRETSYPFSLLNQPPMYTEPTKLYHFCHRHPRSFFLCLNNYYNLYTCVDLTVRYSDIDLREKRKQYPLCCHE